uniref:Uncharacterized protein n=1 Tax=Glossina palpalis gambiensis TaxID=67801 RepID=A0A1B0AKN4_9MUSC
MLDWAADFDLGLNNILEDMTNEQETSNLIANEELEMRESNLVEIYTQPYALRYFIYKHELRKTATTV